jgi:hypothetical protein
MEDDVCCGQHLPDVQWFILSRLLLLRQEHGDQADEVQQKRILRVLVEHGGPRVEHNCALCPAGNCYGLFHLLL